MNRASKQCLITKTCNNGTLYRLKPKLLSKAKESNWRLNRDWSRQNDRSSRRQLMGHVIMGQLGSSGIKRQMWARRWCMGKLVIIIVEVRQVIIIHLFYLIYSKIPNNLLLPHQFHKSIIVQLHTPQNIILMRRHQHNRETRELQTISVPIRSITETWQQTIFIWRLHI